MRFPFSLTRSLAGYLLRKRFSGETRFPLVLMLEPLHACNLSCRGCGRIREYAHRARERLTLAECLASADECGAPVVSVCGGEPLLYAEIGPLVAELIARGKHVYLCTNGLLLQQKLALFRPSSRLFINVHLDGMAETHDRLVEREGAFAQAVAGLQAANRAGFQVCTNTTIYKETDLHEIAVLFAYLAELGVDGLMISPAYGYEAVCQGELDGGQRLFMTRDEVHAKFREARRLPPDHKLTATPIYQEFLRGERELRCAAWANPTRNVAGWKGPCYLITDAHYESYQQLLDATDWDQFGPGGDPRCEHCLVHCGFEPAAVLFGQRRLRDKLKMAVWQIR